MTQPLTAGMSRDWGLLNVEDPVFMETRLSYGIAPVMNRFYQWSLDRKRPVWDMYLVNVMTLLRNCIGMYDSVQETIDQVARDLDTLTKYISSYTGINRMDPVDPKLIYYLPTYEKIPPAYLLESEDKQRQALAKVYSKFTVMVKDHSEIFEALKVYYVHVGKSKLPHLDLIHRIPAIEPRYRYKRICMLSSFPVDYHMYRFIPSFSIIRSHTADVMTKEQFGEKIFKYPIPFNAYTHIVMGDKKMIKCPLSIKQKRQVLALAETKRWKYQPDHVILEQLVSLDLVPKSYLTELKL